MKKLAFFIVLVIFFAPIGCGIGGVDTVMAVPFTLKNNSTEDTHMWITLESIGPNNKLQPNKSRESVYVLVNHAGTINPNELTDDETVTVYAGRNGNVLASKTYTVNNHILFRDATWNGTSIN